MMNNKDQKSFAHRLIEFLRYEDKENPIILFEKNSVLGKMFVGALIVMTVAGNIAIITMPLPLGLCGIPFFAGGAIALYYY